jgi:hypothetical protein
VTKQENDKIKAELNEIYFRSRKDTLNLYFQEQYTRLCKCSRSDKIEEMYKEIGDTISLFSMYKRDNLWKVN